jgi:mannose-6-phosphate isomerase-like protein (cupin superfamily)
MATFNKDMIELATRNSHFQQEVYLDKRVQIVLMHLPPGEDIGAETHRADQTTFFVSGEGKAEIDGQSTKVGPNHMIVIPQGTVHNITNTGKEPLKLFSVYAPPAEPAGVSFKTKEEAEAAEHDGGVIGKAVDAAKDALHKVTG